MGLFASLGAVGQAFCLDVPTRSTSMTCRTTLLLAGFAVAVAASPGCDATTPATPVIDGCKGLTSGQICTAMGNGRQGFDGDGHHRLESWLYWPNDLGIDGEDRLYVLDWNNHRVRRTLADDSVQTVMGAEKPGDGDPGKLDLSTGAQGTTVELNHPSDVLFSAMDTPVSKKGDLVVTAWHNHRLRTWDPKTGLVLTTCGSVPGFFGDGAHASKATKLNQPSKLHQDAQGTTFVVDMRNWRIRRIAKDGIITTIAGNGKPGPVADEGPVKALESSFLFFDPAEWGNPYSPGGGLATAADGKTLYIADTENHRIRALDLESGVLKTVAGSGPSGCDAAGVAAECKNDVANHPTTGSFAGDDGSALQARLNRPHDLAFGPDGRLYFADTGNHRVRALDLAKGTIATFAGGGPEPKNIKPLAASALGDGKLATVASLHTPKGVAFDSKGNLYIADTYNHRIRKVVK
ncbi:MAG: hypothetical protein EXR79_10130 [Myxococcales bacterium]|nr:hypothetical protein [Myxococcales bacterium]